MDNVVVDTLYDTLVHLVSNLADHGLEVLADREAAAK